MFFPKRKEYVPIIVINFLVKPKKNYFFCRFLGINKAISSESIYILEKFSILNYG